MKEICESEILGRSLSKNLNSHLTYEAENFRKYFSHRNKHKVDI